MTSVQVNSFTESKKPASLLWPFLTPYRLHIGVALLAVGVAASTVLTFGWGLKNLVDEGFSDRSGHYLNQALLVLLGVILLLAAASYTRFYLVHWVAERVIAEMRKKIYQHLLVLDPGYFETHKTGDQVSRINTDTTVLQMVMTSNLPTAFRNLLTMMGGVVMLFIVSPVMTGMVAGVVPFVIGPIIYFGRKVRAKSRDTQGRLGEISSFSHETIQGLQTIQSFGYEETASNRFSALADDTFNAALRYVKVRAFLTAFVISMVFSAIGVVLWMGGHQVLTGEISVGNLSAFIFYAVVTAGAAGALSETMTSFNQAVGAADRIASLLGKKAGLKGSDSTKALPQNIEGHVSFNHVSFSYPTRAEQLALDNLTFTIPPGRLVALTGPSGAGKTTIFQLLQRFYDPSGGVITIDGLDITGYNARDIRRHIGVVSQDPAIFSCSIAENIRVGKPDATDAEVRHAAELAQAHEFIALLPEGYNTLVGERGSRLSGGQRQRIAIARVLLKNPKILLLDEATSALDSSNEQAVMLALKSLMVGRTTIVIAHRLSTVQNADKIIVLDQGRIVAEGTHDQLYGKDSLYTHLAGLQMQVRAG
ncbi:MAG: ATP-binding cassette domain-containing protein [Alphaproteobacteria bacterium]|nr:ATP-binding cassette domain-containing protein [Alphaproteobacteria bacterium]